MAYYEKLKVVINYQTKSGLKGKCECGSIPGLVSEAISMGFKELGEETMQALFNKELERAVRLRKEFEAAQKK